MTSWEDVINQVTIPGDGGAIAQAGGAWSVIFQRIREAKRYLDDGLKDLEIWEGEAGQTYREKVGGLAQKLGTLDTENSAIVAQLSTASTEINTAIGNIPIPAELIHAVVTAREEFRGTGRMTGLGPDAIYEHLRGFYEGGIPGMIANAPFGIGDALTGLRNWISSQDEEAIRHYNTLNGQYANVAAGIPYGSTIPSSLDPTLDPIPTTPFRGGGPSGGLPGTGGLGDLPGGGLEPGGTRSLDPPGTTGLDGAGAAFEDPDLSDGTGLAGAGDGGLSGAGAAGGQGAGGLGNGLGGRGLTGAGPGGSALGGLDGAGGLARGAGLGPLTSPPGLAGVLGGAGAGAAGRGGAGIGRGGAGAGRGMAGMMAAPMTGAGNGSEDEHSTWLQEDDDVWGTDTGAPPSLLT